eukprot:g70477.t1
MSAWFVPCLLLLFHGVKGGQNLTVVQPESLKNQFPGGSVTMRPALFGVVPYGRSIVGTVVYATPGDRSGCAPLPWMANWDNINTPLIMLIDRGECMFVTKVRHAQEAGAQAAVIVDNVDESSLPYMADDGTGNDITIPSMLVYKRDGAKIKTELQQNKTVVLRMAWDVPIDNDGTVNWKLWTSPWEPMTRDFKGTFKNAVQKLGSRANFTANFYIIDGSRNGCTRSADHCGNTCTNEGRYCYTDPDSDTSLGLSGRQVVAESLRQICLFEETRKRSDLTLWWEYAGMQQEFCDNEWDDTCTREILVDLRGQTLGNALADAVQACVTASGGLTTGPNTKLDAEIRKASVDGIIWLSTVIANNVQYRGGFTCQTPMDITTCGVLDFLCAAYKPEDKPCACDSNPGCGLCIVRDECAVCGGGGRVDACGQCLSPLSAAFNKSCADCAGVPNGGKVRDSCGQCGGSGSYDACHRCLPAGHPARIEPGQGGFDACGKCLKYADPNWNRSCAGCDGVPNSGKLRDMCGKCGGTGSWDACFHCLDKNDSRRVDVGKGGYDVCGECRLFSDPGYNRSCAGCDGVPFSGAKRDRCGVCNGSGSPDACGRCLQADDPSRVTDGSYDNCSVCLPNGDPGRIDGPVIYDACGVCRAKGDVRADSTCKGCDGVPNSGLERDVCGTCNGDATDPATCPTRTGPLITPGDLIGFAILALAIVVLIGNIMLYMHRRRMKSDVERLLQLHMELGGDGAPYDFQAPSYSHVDVSPGEQPNETNDTKETKEAAQATEEDSPADVRRDTLQNAKQSPSPEGPSTCLSVAQQRLDGQDHTVSLPATVEAPGSLERTREEVEPRRARTSSATLHRIVSCLATPLPPRRPRKKSLCSVFHLKSREPSALAQKTQLENDTTTIGGTSKQCGRAELQLAHQLQWILTGQDDEMVGFYESDPATVRPLRFGKRGPGDTPELPTRPGLSPDSKLAIKDQD